MVSEPQEPRSGQTILGARSFDCVLQDELEELRARREHLNTHLSGATPSEESRVGQRLFPKTPAGTDPIEDAHRFVLWVYAFPAVAFAAPPVIWE